MRFVPIFLAGTAALLFSLLLSRVHPFGDAGLYAQTVGAEKIMKEPEIPENVRTTLINKCADCHSSSPQVPFYGNFAPISWLLERDILEARRKMDLSFWDSYSDDLKREFAAKIAHETKAHKMPLPQYKLIHWNSWLTRADIQSFDAWSHTMQGPAVAGADGDAVHGKDVFERRCAGCHSLTQNREGPHLQGVYGRAAGKLPGFGYSSVLKQANITWNETTLERWLAGPDDFLPGADMDFRMPKPQERRDVIAYLKTQNQLAD